MKNQLLLVLPLLCGCEYIIGIRDTYVVEDDAAPIAPPNDATVAADSSPVPPGERVEVRLLNAATGQPLNTSADVIIAGSGREMVVDELGRRQAEYPDTAKSLRFGLAAEAMFPTSLLIRVSGPGLLSTTQPVVLYERGDITVDVRVVAIKSLPSGVHVAMASGAVDADGILTAPVVLGTKAATVTVPEGIVMYDAEGQALAGDITAELVHYESGNAESLAVFPGGMDVSTDEGDGLFASAGLLSLEITDESGRSASTFAMGLVEAEIAVPAGIMNPEQGRALAVGDSIGLWSHDAQTGEWTREGDVEIGDGLVAQFSVDHLSLWNLDFKINKCDVSRAIEVRVLGTFDLVEPETAANFVYELRYSNLDGTRPSFVRRFRPGDITDVDTRGVNNILQFRNAPDVTSGRVVLSAYWKSYEPYCLIRDEDFNSVDGDSLCAEASEGFGLYPVRPPNCEAQ